VHLLLRISPLESPSYFSCCQIVPSLGLPEPFPAFCRIGFGTLTANHFHCAAVLNVDHRRSSQISENWYRIDGGIQDRVTD
jgi:hypothetical protein